MRHSDDFIPAQMSFPPSNFIWTGKSDFFFQVFAPNSNVTTQEDNDGAN